MNETMIKSLKLLLGSNLTDTPLDDDTYEAVIDMSKKAYQRFKGAGYTIENTIVYSWVHDYALAQCKLILGEAYSKIGTMTNTPNSGELLVSTALMKIETLENELR